MLALIQNGRKINYLLWGPSESSPIVEKIGSLDCPELKFSNKKIITELINNIIISTGSHEVSFTICNDDVFFSDLDVPEDISFNDMFRWNQSKYSEYISEKYSVFHYPVGFSDSSYFNIHIRKEIISLLKDVFKEINTNVHSISVGIFSADMACREWYGADGLESYMVLKLSGKGKSYLLDINNNSLNRFIIFKKLKDGIQPLQVLGNHKELDKLINIVNGIVFNKKIPNHPFSKIFIYGNSKKVIDKLVPHSDNYCMLDPFSVLSHSDSLKYDKDKLLQFIESGNSFRGIDV